MTTNGNSLVLESCYQSSRNTLSNRLLCAIGKKTIKLIYSVYSKFHLTWYDYAFAGRGLVRELSDKNNYVLCFPGLIRKTKFTLHDLKNFYASLLKTIFPHVSTCHDSAIFIQMDSVKYLTFNYDIQGERMMIMLHTDKFQDLGDQPLREEIISLAIHRTKRVVFKWVSNGLAYTVLHDNIRDQPFLKRKFEQAAPLRKGFLTLKRARYV
jgi:hypothetical protein